MHAGPLTGVIPALPVTSEETCLRFIHSFASTASTWCSAVRTDRPKDRAISLFVRCCASSTAVLDSCGVRPRRQSHSHVTAQPHPGTSHRDFTLVLFLPLQVLYVSAACNSAGAQPE